MQKQQQILRKNKNSILSHFNLWLNSVLDFNPHWSPFPTVLDFPQKLEYAMNSSKLQGT